MPRVKPIDEYPEAYFNLFSKAFDEGEARLPCLEYGDAKAIRSHLYTFRRVLRKTPEYAELAIKADAIKLSIEPGYLVLKKKVGFAEEQIKEALDNVNSET